MLGKSFNIYRYSFAAAEKNHGRRLPLLEEDADVYYIKSQQMEETQMLMSEVFARHVDSSQEWEGHR